MSDDNYEDVDLSHLEAEFDDVEEIPQVITHDMLMRRLAWDLTPHALVLDLCNRMNLDNPSSEVVEREHEDAHARLYALTPLIPFLAVTAQMSASIMRETTLMVTGLDDHPSLDEDALTVLVRTAALGIVSELLDSELIHLAPVVAM